MTEPYRLTQVAWLVIVATMIPMGILLTFLAAQDVGFAAGLVLFVTVAILATLSTMTVSVDDEVLEVRFGIGLFRRRIALREIRAASPIRTTWLQGVGLRWLSDGWLYNVRTGPALELMLEGGRRVQIGTPDPAALQAAIEARLGADWRRSTAAAVESSTRWLGLLAIPLVVFVAVGTMLYRDSRPPQVAVAGGMLVIRGGTYASETPLDSITSASLEDFLPHINRRINGFAFGGKLRGHFRVDALGGRGMIFVDRDRPPFLVVRTARSFVIVNGPNPDVTRRIASELAAQRGG